MSTRSPFVVALECLALAAFAVLYAVLLLRIARSIDGLPALAAVLAALPIGMIAADLGSGLVHWACDTFFEEATPVLGPTIIHSFREHHREPEAMTRHGFVELSGASAWVLAPLVGVALAAGPLGPFGDALVAVFGGGTTLTNLFHRWAHTGAVPAPVVFAQRRGWILPPEHHAGHHEPPHRRAYCVTTGWANPWLDAIEFWPRAERGIRRLARARAGV